MNHASDKNVTLVRLAREGDRQAQEELVKNNMGLIWNIVKKFNNRGHELEDLFQIGTIGFMKAIKKFDLKYNVRFSTYAVPMIIGEIKRFLRDDGIIKVSRSMKETSNKARAVKEILSKELGREPTVKEIADKLNITPEELAVAMDVGISPESLNSPVYEGESNPIYLIDRIDSNECEENKVVDKIVLSQILKDLEPKERKIIILRYFKEKTQAQIAKMLGISQVQVSRLEKKIINQIRKKLKTSI